MPRAHRAYSRGGVDVLEVLLLLQIIQYTGKLYMVLHMVLLAVPALAGGFLQAFQLAFVLWPFNLALPLARDLPRACITLRGVVAFYAAGLRGYVSGARRGVELLQQAADSSSPRAGGVPRTREDAVAHAMMAFDDIY